MLKINVSFGMTWKVISVTAKKNMWKSWKKGKKTKRFTVESTDLTSLPAFPPFLNKSGCKSQCIKHTAWQLIKKKNHQCAKCYIFLDFSICVLVFNVKTDLWFFVIKKKKDYNSHFLSQKFIFGILLQPFPPVLLSLYLKSQLNLFHQKNKTLKVRFHHQTHQGSPGQENSG